MSRLVGTAAFYCVRLLAHIKKAGLLHKYSDTKENEGTKNSLTAECTEKRGGFIGAIRPFDVMPRSSTSSNWWENLSPVDNDEGHRRAAPLCHAHNMSHEKELETWINNDVKRGDRRENRSLNTSSLSDRLQKVLYERIKNKTQSY